MLDADQSEIAIEPFDHFRVDPATRTVVDHDNFVVVGAEVALIAHRK